MATPKHEEAVRRGFVAQPVLDGSARLGMEREKRPRQGITGQGGIISSFEEPREAYLLNEVEELLEEAGRSLEDNEAEEVLKEVQKSLGGGQTRFK